MNLSGNGLVSYNLSRILDNIVIISQKTQTIINGILSIVSFFSFMVASWATGWVRRRIQFLTSVLVMFSSFLSVTIANARFSQDESNKGVGGVVIFFVFTLCVAIIGGLTLWLMLTRWKVRIIDFNMLTIPTCLVLPYNVRIVGVYSLGLACHLTGFFNTFVNPIALDAISWKYYIVCDPCLEQFTARTDTYNFGLFRVACC